MALAVASSTVSLATASATALQVPYPASIAANDYGLLIVATKPFNATIQTPSGWTLLGTRTNGTTAAGTDTGSMQIAAFVRKFAGGETGNLTVTITSGNSSWGSMYRVTKAAGMDVQAAFTSGLDTVANTALSVPFDSNPGITSGDLLIMGIAWSTDVARTVSASAFAATGATFSGIAAAGNQNPRITTGLDSGGNTNSCTCASGTASAAPTWTATLSVGTNGTGPAVLVRLREFPPVEISGNLAVTALPQGAAVVPVTGTGAAFRLRRAGGGSMLRSGAYLRGQESSPVETIDGTRPVTATATGAAAGVRSATGTRPVTATLAGAATVTLAATGTTAVTAATAATATRTQTAAGTLAVTATGAGAAGHTANASGTLSVTASLPGAGAIAKLFKTLHKSIGHAPGSIADIEVAFSPNTASGGWHRGDGVLPVHGTGWSLYCFNDFYVSDGAGGVQVFFRRNSVLMVDHDDGQVWWLSSGDGFGLAGSVTFPGPPEGGGSWAWLNGGWATGADSCILLGSTYSSGGAHLEHRVMAVTGLTGSAPPYTVTHPCGLDHTAGIQWHGTPVVVGSHAYVYGIDGLAQVVARVAVSTNPAAYGPGAWAYWTGTGWSTDVADRAWVTVEAGPLRALSFIAWQGRYLAAAKDFDSAPELGLSNTDWTEVKVWMSDNPWGPWEYHGIVADSEVTDWWSYAARVELLPGMTELSVIWSINTNINFDPDLYGPQFAVPDQVGHLDAVAAITGVAGFVSSTTGTVAATAAPTGTVALQAAASGTRTATTALAGAITADRPAAGSTAVTAALTGAAQVVRSVAGTVAATGTTAAAVAATKPVASTRPVTATTAATAATAQPAAGTLPVTVTPAGTATGDRPAGGSRTITAALSGAVTGDLTTSGTRPATVATTGAAATSQPAGDQLDVTASTAGAAARVQPVDGSGAATASTAGSVTVSAGTAGTVAAVADTSAAVALTVHGDGDLDVAAAATGATSGIRPVTAAVAVTAATAGTVTATRPSDGVVESAVELTGTATVDSAGVWAADGNLETTATTTGNATGQFGTSGDRPATVTATGTGAVDHPTAGAMAVSAAAAGAVTVARAVDGSCIVTATGEGGAAGARPAAGVLEAEAGTAGGAVTAQPAAGVLAVEAAFSGAAGTGAFGNLDGTSTVTGAATAVRAAAGSVEITAAVTGAATTGQPSEGTVALAVALSGTGEVTAADTETVAGLFVAAADTAGGAAVARTVDGAWPVTADLSATVATARAAAGETAVTITVIGDAETVAAGAEDIDGARTVSAALTGAGAVTRSAAGTLTVAAAQTAAASVAGAEPTVVVDPPHGAGPVDDVSSSDGYDPLTDTLAVAGTADAPAGVERVEVSVNGGAPTVAAGTTTWTVILDTSWWEPGAYHVAVTVVEVGGATSTEETVVWFNPGGMWGAAASAGEHLVPVEMAGV